MTALVACHLRKSALICGKDFPYFPFKNSATVLM
jgi:hypothetical protein